MVPSMEKGTIVLSINFLREPSAAFNLLYQGRMEINVQPKTFCFSPQPNTVYDGGNGLSASEIK